jgi:hypothetical protein
MNTLRVCLKNGNSPAAVLLPVGFVGLLLAARCGQRDAGLNCSRPKSLAAAEFRFFRQTLKGFGRNVGWLLVALLGWVAPAEAQYVFTTIDDPIAKTNNHNQTVVSGISGNTVVGYYYGPQLHGFYHVLGTSNFVTLDEPLGLVNGTSDTQPEGISGGSIVGNYQNYQGSASGYYGFLYDIASGTYQTLNDPAGDRGNTSVTWPTGIDGTNIVGYVGVSVPPYLDYVGGFEAQSTGAGFVCDPQFYYPGISSITIGAGYNTTNYATYIYGISGTNAVGCWVDQNGVNHGIIYNLVAGTYTALLAPNGFGCCLTGIDGNNVAGYYADANHSYNYSGFVYNLASSSYTATSIHDPLALGNSYLLGISGNTLVGYFSDSNGYTHGFVATVPVPVLTLAFTRNGLVFAATNGIPGATSHLITTTNLTAPHSQWSVISTNIFNTNGVFSYTNTATLTAPATFIGLSEAP